MPSWKARRAGMIGSGTRLFCDLSADLSARTRQQHADLVAVGAIALAELRDQITLLEPDADEDVARRRYGKEQVPGRHDRRRPEPEHEPQVDRMAHQTVEKGRAELGRRNLAPGEA